MVDPIDLLVTTLTTAPGQDCAGRALGADFKVTSRDRFSPPGLDGYPGAFAGH